MILKNLLQRADLAAVEVLQRQVNALERELAAAQEAHRISALGQRSLAKRANELKKAHPDIWRLFFTREGDAERKQRS